MLYVKFNVPHVVVFMENRPSDKVVCRMGAAFQKKIDANINFISKTEDEAEIQYYVSTYERGAGLTFACGTGVCASFLAAFHTGQAMDECMFMTKGGTLVITLEDGH